MKKVIALVGTGRKGHTYKAAHEFLAGLEALGGVQTEIVEMGEYRLGLCRGCKLCFSKGKAYCPLKDDRDVLIEKMEAADGVVFASPNYSFQVSAIMKAFLDRLGYAFHRPQFFGKTATSIVVQGIHGGGKIVKYLDFAAWGLGFSVVKGTSHTAFEPMTVKEEAKRDRALAKQATAFHRQLSKPAYPVPGLVGLAIFNFARTSVFHDLDESSLDYRYYREKGWFESDYYYPTRLGPAKKVVGSLFYSVGTSMAKARAS